MKRIATHNSFTGEKGCGLLSSLVAPFSKCQSKTLKEQHLNGCRLFDLRVKWDKSKGKFVAAHGLWTAQKSIVKLLSELDAMAAASPIKTFYMLTYEGKCEEGSEIYKNFVKLKECLVSVHKHLECVQLSIKKPYWRVLWSSPQMSYYTAAFEVLTKDNWRTLIPIPWLWAKIRGKVEFNHDYFRMVDFL